MSQSRHYDIDQDVNIRTADELSKLELFHVAYDYYKYVVDWYEGYHAANDYSQHQERLFKEKNNILYCKTGMLCCQFRLAAVELSVLENNISVLIEDPVLIEALNVAIQRSGSDKKYLRFCVRALCQMRVEIDSPGAKIAYILSYAKLLSEKINTAAFSEYAQSMEIDENNFDQKFRRLNAAVLSLRKLNLDDDIITKLKKAIAILRAGHVVEPPSKKRRLGADMFAEHVYTPAPQQGEVTRRYTTLTGAIKRGPAS